MHANSTRSVKVEPGGRGVVAHAGLHALGRYADQIGLPAALSSCIEPRGERAPLHDRGKVLTQMALVLAGGGESCLDIEHLRAQPTLFGTVPSDTTVSRSLHALDGKDRNLLAAGIATTRASVWHRLGLTESTAPLFLDVDSTLVEIHTEDKEGAAPHYKGGYGFHPMLCFADETGEALAAVLRPGNANANTAQDHVVVLDRALAQLPREARHRQVVLRADSAGATRATLNACAARGVRFMANVATNAQIQGAIFEVKDLEVFWTPALRGDGELRQGAAVTELTELVDLSSFPVGTRLVVRREPLHQGAQRSLFPSLEFRYVGFVTDLEGEPADLDVVMRAHAHVEQHLARLKDAGLCRMPFSRYVANESWLMEVCLAADLVRWFQLECLEGSWRDARPKALRWQLWHAPARVVRRSRDLVVRILEHWPTADVLLGAHRRIALLT
jgi:hypothetical protein